MLGQVVLHRLVLKVSATKKDGVNCNAGRLGADCFSKPKERREPTAATQEERQMRTDEIFRDVYFSDLKELKDFLNQFKESDLLAYYPDKSSCYLNLKLITRKLSDGSEVTNFTFKMI